MTRYIANMPDREKRFFLEFCVRDKAVDEDFRIFVQKIGAVRDPYIPLYARIYEEGYNTYSVALTPLPKTKCAVVSVSGERRDGVDNLISDYLSFTDFDEVERPDIENMLKEKLLTAYVEWMGMRC